MATENQYQQVQSLCFLSVVFMTGALTTVCAHTVCAQVVCQLHAQHWAHVADLEALDTYPVSKRLACLTLLLA